ncbi:MAG TPA: hypothetical protein PLH26_06700 [Agriterribacter sp.]|nr:hypothetical protein [Agriterribacter sp.]
MDRRRFGEQEKFTKSVCSIELRRNIEDVQIRFLHINHLILDKKAVNRAKDQIDVE